MYVYIYIYLFLWRTLSNTVRMWEDFETQKSFLRYQWMFLNIPSWEKRCITWARQTLCLLSTSVVMGVSPSHGPLSLSHLCLSLPVSVSLGSPCVQT